MKKKALNKTQLIFLLDRLSKPTHREYLVKLLKLNNEEKHLFRELLLELESEGSIVIEGNKIIPKQCRIDRKPIALDSKIIFEYISQKKRYVKIKEIYQYFSMYYSVDDSSIMRILSELEMTEKITSKNGRFKVKELDNKLEYSIIKRINMFFDKPKDEMRLGRLLKKLKIKTNYKSDLLKVLDDLKHDGKIKPKKENQVRHIYHLGVKKEVSLNEDTLLTYFNMRKKSVPVKTIIRDLGFYGEEKHNKLIELLSKLELEGKIYQKKMGFALLPEESNLIVGQVILPRQGKGYVKNVIINPEYLNGVLNGDIVLIEIINDSPNRRPQGVIRKIIKRSNSYAPFTYQNGELVPYGFTFNYKLDIDQNLLVNFQNGDRIGVLLSNQMDRNTFKVESLKLIARKNDPEIEYKSIATKYGADISPSPEIDLEVSKIPQCITKKDLVGRIDYRDEQTITIDGIHTKDMDDAVYCKKLEDGSFILNVHITDVAYWISSQSKIFERAKNNSFSLYLVNVVFPMIHSLLTNGILSLNEGADRLTVTTSMKIDAEGKVKDYDFNFSVIQSKKKMTYDDVNKIIEDGIMVPGYEPYKQVLNDLACLTEKLEYQSKLRGALEFAETDLDFDVDIDGNPTHFKRKEMRTAEKMIKESMILTGVCFAEYYKWLDLPFIKRVHVSPNDAKIKSAIEYINSLGYKTRHPRNIDNPKNIQRIIEQIISQIDSEEEFIILAPYLLKGLERAGYSIDDLGHYGLALHAYAQVTSPIRRICDLVNQYLHRLYTSPEFSMTDLERIKLIKNDLVEIALRATRQEEKYDLADKESEAMEMATQMETKIGEYRNARITQIDPTGIWVVSEDNVYGRVRFEDVLSGNYRYDFDTRSLYNNKNKASINVMDIVRVRIKSASRENRTIDFKIVEVLEKKLDKGRQYKKSTNY